MAYIDRMKEARKRKGLTQEQLATMIGVAKPTYNGYEKGNSEPNMLTLTKIMNVLEVDADFLFQDEVLQRKENTASPSEMDMVKKYRSLDDHGKKLIDVVLEHEIKRIDQLNTTLISFPENVIPLQRSVQAVSAGRGVYLGPEDMEIIHVLENDLTARAAFCVPVSGDSMEPTYHDGDVLLVQGKDKIEPGQIGVFTVDGEGYIKKLGAGQLISLNPDYAPIPLTEDSWCNGLVIGALNPAWVVR